MALAFFFEYTNKEVPISLHQKISHFIIEQFFAQLNSSPQTCDQHCPVRVRKWRRDL
jgi:hypothetical protein